MIFNTEQDIDFIYKYMLYYEKEKRQQLDYLGRYIKIAS